MVPVRGARHHHLNFSERQKTMTHQNGPHRAYQAPPAGKKPRRGLRVAVIGVGAAGLLVAAAVVFAPGRPVDTAAVVDQAPVATKTVTVTVTPPAVTTVTAPPLPAVTVTYTPPKPAGIGDGIYKVGPGGIDAGRYVTEGGGGSCYYARLKNDSGDFGAIITNNNLDGPGSVTVKAGEFFQVRGGCEFRKA